MSSAYLEVTFTKSVRLQSGTLEDLKARFGISGTSSPTITSASIVNGKVRLLLPPDNCPQPGESVEITYTNPGAGVAGALVDSTTDYPVADLTVISGDSKIQSLALSIFLLSTSTNAHES